jgi:chromosome segregation ATPase
MDSRGLTGDAAEVERLKVALERERSARKAAEAVNAEEVVRRRTNLEAQIESLHAEADAYAGEITDLRHALKSAAAIARDDQETIARLREENAHLRKSIENSDRDHWFEEAGVQGERNRVLAEAAVEDEKTIERLRALLSEAVAVIEGLAEQQAMEDDWWELDRDRFKEALK